GAAGAPLSSHRVDATPAFARGLAGRLSSPRRFLELGNLVGQQLIILAGRAAALGDFSELLLGFVDPPELKIGLRAILARVGSLRMLREHLEVVIHRCIDAAELAQREPDHGGDARVALIASAERRERLRVLATLGLPVAE